ncbi:MAG: hypothetical protein PWR29_237 [Methanolobus sp.]|jgi:hypothetical protein|nr:hypothetical protein [Methanolobus sp.]MDK2911280.1 hypothetical protein [Methanolobus sp.]MDN5310784.1 hypothetical protein [Methanolobus sp.]
MASSEAVNAGTIMASKSSPDSALLRKPIVIRIHPHQQYVVL